MLRLEPGDEALAPPSSIARKRRKACILCRSRRTALRSARADARADRSRPRAGSARRAARARSAHRQREALRVAVAHDLLDQPATARGSAAAARLAVDGARRTESARRRRVQATASGGTAPRSARARQRKPSRSAPVSARSARWHANRLPCAGGVGQPRRRSALSASRGRPVVGRDQERARALEAARQPADIGEPQARVPARRQDAVDGARAEPRHAQQHLAVGGVDVDREAVAVPAAPRRASDRRRAPASRPRRGGDLFDAEAVESAAASRPGRAGARAAAAAP